MAKRPGLAIVLASARRPKDDDEREGHGRSLVDDGADDGPSTQEGKVDAASAMIDAFKAGDAEGLVAALDQYNKLCRYDKDDDEPDGDEAA